MNQHGHTRHPWRLKERLTASENHKGWLIYAGLKLIAEVMPMSDAYGDPSPEALCNARLMTAAPELAEALELCAQYFYARRPIDPTSQTGQLLATIASALAKAKEVQS